MNEPRLRHAYWVGLIGNASDASHGRGHAGYSLWQRYWASLMGIRLPVRSEFELLVDAIHDRYPSGLRLVDESPELSGWTTPRLSPQRFAAAAAVAMVALILLTWGIGPETGSPAEPSSVATSSRPESTRPSLWRSEHLTISVPDATSIAFDRDGETAAVGIGDGTVQLMGPAAPNSMVGFVGTIGSAAVKTVAFSPDGRLLVSGSSDGSVQLWDVATRRRLSHLGIHDAAVVTVAFSPFGRQVAVGGGGSVTLWDVATYRPLDSNPLAVSVAGGQVNSVAFGASGVVAIGVGDGSVWLWDTWTGSMDSLPAVVPGTAVNSVVLSPDSMSLVSGSSDGSVRLWNLWDRRSTGEMLDHHESVVNSVAFSPDGKWIASGAADGAVRVRKVGGDQPSRLLDGPRGSVLSVVFGRDSRQIVAASGDGSVQMWNLP